MLLVSILFTPCVLIGLAKLLFVPFCVIVAVCLFSYCHMLTVVVVVVVFVVVFSKVIVL